MRILIVSSNRSLCLRIDHALQQQALTAELAELGTVLFSCDRPVVIYHAPRWESCISRTVQRLSEQTDNLFVVCPDALAPAGRLAIAESGAWDGYHEDRTSLHLLALQVYRIVIRESSARLELGPLVLDVLGGSLSAAGRMHLLTPGEVRLLRALWPASAAIPEAGLSGYELAALARMPEFSVRNHVAHLRLKIADLAGDTVMLLHQRSCGYRLALRGEAAPGSRDTSEG
ncbi:MAG: hypothetical protein M1298_02645 [Chloroflexi bacterium]|nr:hypothetical protein [Chloroflexota bacterium]